MEAIVYEFLDALGIDYLVYQHEAAPTVEHVAELENMIRGKHCKNLFLKNSKADQLYMLIAPHDKPVDLKKTARLIGSTRLSFAEADKMWQYLKLEPGSVSPFGLIHDEESHIIVLLDQDILAYEYINFHPNINTATVSIQTKDFNKFLDAVGNTWRTLEL